MPDADDARPGRWRKRLAWFVAFYLVSLLAFFSVIYVLRALVPR